MSHQRPGPLQVNFTELLWTPLPKNHVFAAVSLLEVDVIPQNKPRTEAQVQATGVINGSRFDAPTVTLTLTFSGSF